MKDSQGSNDISTTVGKPVSDSLDIARFVVQ